MAWGNQKSKKHGNMRIRKKRVNKPCLIVVFNCFMWYKYITHPVLTFFSHSRDEADERSKWCGKNVTVKVFEQSAFYGTMIYVEATNGFQTVINFKVIFKYSWAF